MTSPAGRIIQQISLLIACSFLILGLHPTPATSAAKNDELRACVIEKSTTGVWARLSGKGKPTKGDKRVLNQCKNELKTSVTPDPAWYTEFLATSYLDKPLQYEILGTVVSFSGPPFRTVVVDNKRDFIAAGDEICRRYGLLLNDYMLYEFRRGPDGRPVGWIKVDESRISALKSTRSGAIGEVWWGQNVLWASYHATLCQVGGDVSKVNNMQPFVGESWLPAYNRLHTVGGRYLGSGGHAFTLLATWMSDQEKAGGNPCSA